MSQRLYKISEIAQRHGLTLRALRFWEDKGLIKPERRGATRLYDDAVDATVGMISQMRRAGFTIEDIREILRRAQDGQTVEAWDLFFARYEQTLAAAELQGQALAGLMERATQAWRAA